MFRSSNLEGNTPIDNISAFHGLSGLNMYLDTTCQPNLSPPVSSATLSPPTTPLTPESPIPATQFPLLAESNIQQQQQQQASSLLLHRQYQYHLLLQQQQQQLALAQHNLALAASAAAVNHHQKDEIAHSLKMFALLTACNADTGPGSTQDAMQEFATNGYVTDDFNRLQYQSSQSCPTPQPSPVPRQQFAAPATGPSNTVTAMPPALAAAHWLSLNNYREQLNNVWRSVSMSYMPNMATNAGLAMASASQSNLNADHMRSASNSNNIANNNCSKVHKRFNGQKAKEQVQRHCVFCENNNEPEAVVNSHSVRDAYGRVLCPKLRTYVCPICGASGDSAHTIKYCPKKPIVTMEDAIKAESFRLAKSNYYKQQMKV